MTGLANTLVLIFLGGLVGMYSTYLLVRVYHFNPEVESYPELVGKVLGRRHHTAISVVLATYITFSTTMYIFFCSVILEAVYMKRTGAGPLTFGQMSALKAVLAVAGWAFNLFHLERIRWLSYVANFFSLCLGLLLVAQLPGRFAAMQTDPKIVMFRFEVGFFTVIGNILFAYVSHFSVITIVKVLRESRASLKYRALFRSQFIAMTLYTLVCYAGYLSFGEDTPGLIVVRPSVKGSSDWPFTVCQLGLSFGLIVSICVRITSNVDTCTALFGGPRLAGRSERKFAVGVAASLVPLFLSLWVQRNFLSVISFTISLLCPHFMIIAPSCLISADEPEDGETDRPLQVRRRETQSLHVRRFGPFGGLPLDERLRVGNWQKEVSEVNGPCD